jgi:hypothetical protein
MICNDGIESVGQRRSLTFSAVRPFEHTMCCASDRNTSGAMRTCINRFSLRCISAYRFASCAINSRSYDANISNDSSNKLSRCYIKCWIPYIDALCCYSYTIYTCQFLVKQATDRWLFVTVPIQACKEQIRMN